MLGIGVPLGERFALHWRPDRSAAYEAALKANSDLHSMLRYPQRTHQSRLTEQAWQTYLDDHFGPPGEVQDSSPSPSEIATPLAEATHPGPSCLQRWCNRLVPPS